MCHRYRRSYHHQYNNRQVITNNNVASRKNEDLSEKEDSLMTDTEEIPVARPFTKKYTDFLNLTVNESDSGINQISKHSDISNSNNHKVEENKKKRKLRETSISPSARKRNNKAEMNARKKVKTSHEKKKVLNEEDSQQQPLIVFPKCFRKSESFDRPEFLLWLESNPHLYSIKGGASNICELLDMVRIENPALNKNFLPFAENDEKVNPYFFDIAQLVRPNDSLILPPKWDDRTDLEATYVWSFDIPSKDLNTYCEEIEKDISDHPHQDTDTDDYRPAIVAQFRNYLETELPLDNQVNIFRWLYVGQTQKKSIIEALETLL
jgi:hypothetical protein